MRAIVRPTPFLRAVVRLATTCSIAAVASVVVLVGPAVADAAQDAERAAAQAREAEARAAAAAVQVEQLTAAYSEASLRVRVGLTDLAQAFAESTEAVQAVGAARTGLAQARSVRSRRVRALYSSGGPSMLAASVLSATSPEDAMWRAATAERVLRGLVNDAQSDVADGQQAAALAAARQQQADAAADARAATLDRLEADSRAAEEYLTQAHATLAALDENARRATIAADAAKALAEAEAAALAAQRAAVRTAARTTVTAAGIPDEFAAAYQQFSATCPGLRWTLLAAVGQVESGHGRNNGPSSAGAVGPMQFMPATFASFGVDGDGDGVKDVWDPQDAVASAANYLCSRGIDGTPAGDQKALLAYNHAQWYVDLVLDTEAAIISEQPAAAAP